MTTFPTRVVAVADHHGEDEVAGVHQQARLDQVAVHGVASRAAPRLNFERDRELVVKPVDLVGLALATLIAEEHRSPDLLCLGLARLDLEPDRLEIGSKLGERLVACQTDMRA